MTPKSIIENRFNYFLVIIIGLILSNPLFPPIGSKGVFPFALLIYTAAGVFILRTILKDNKTFFFFIFIYLALFIVDIFCTMSTSAWTETFDHLSLIAHAIVLGLLTKDLFETLFRTNKVTADSIKGGICIYFLLGLLWGMAYRFIYHFDPHAFIFNVPGNTNLFYFSYVTLTTVGYGDIFPASRLTQALAILEAAAGQLFIAIYIARLLGLHMANEMKKD